jgi:hypothetical protein
MPSSELFADEHKFGLQSGPIGSLMALARQKLSDILADGDGSSPRLRNQWFAGAVYDRF